MRRLALAFLVACGTQSTTPVGDAGQASDAPSTGDATASPDAGDAAIPPVDCMGSCRYVREGATGAGTSWDDALGTLPAALERGKVYLVAAGTYAGYRFDDAAGPKTRVVRATEADHGDAPGWLPAYGMGVATFGPLVFQTSDWELDGKGALVVKGTFQSTTVDIEGDRVTVRGVEIDGAFALSAGKHTGGSCTLMNIGADDVVVDACHMHDAADDGVSISGRNVLFTRNHVHALHGCGTDGACGPCYNGHSDGLELYAVKDSSFSQNYVHHVKSTAAVFFGNWADELGMGPADYCENVTFTNNVFYSPDTGFAVYFEDVKGLSFANNVVWGVRQGAYGGLAIGTHVTSLDMVNNVILSVNTAHLGSAYNGTEHRGDYNAYGVALGQWPTQTHDFVAADPQFVGIPSITGMDVPGAVATDFAPKPTSPLLAKGTTGGKVPTTDFAGKVRGNPPTVGAFE